MPPAPQVGSFRTLTRAGPGLAPPPPDGLVGQRIGVGPEAGPFNRVPQALGTHLCLAPCTVRPKEGGPGEEAHPCLMGTLGQFTLRGFYPVSL